MPKQHMNATARRGLVSSKKNQSAEPQQSGSMIKFKPNPDIKDLPPYARKSLAGKQLFIPEKILSNHKEIVVIALTLLRKHLPKKKIKVDQITVPKSAFAVIRHCKQP